MGAFIARVRGKYLEGFYSVHVKVRYLHDKTYQKGPRWYKKWSDKSYSNNVHKATLIAFVFSFVFFSVLQSIFPYLFNPGKPNVALAGSNSVTWDTQAHFDNNGAAGGGYSGATIKTNVTSKASGAVELSNNGNNTPDGSFFQKNTSAGTADTNAVSYRESVYLVQVFAW